MKTTDRLFIPAFAYHLANRPGMKNLLADPALRRNLGILLGVGGGASGYNTEGDVTSTTGDGVDTNLLWSEFQETMRLRNTEQDNLLRMLSFRTTSAAQKVYQSGDVGLMEEASEFGVPVGVRPDFTPLTLAFGFKWFDVGAKFTWKYLVSASSEEVRQVNNTILAMDQRTTFAAVLGALFNNTARTNDLGQTVYPLYNNDGTVPPSFGGQTFAGTHTHYLQSAGATVASGDLDTLTDHVLHHGYGLPGSGSRLLIFVNRQEGQVIEGFTRAGGARHDFIPSSSAPSYLTDQNIVGQIPPASFGQIAVKGSYGDAWISENHRIPAGYLLAVASGGANNTLNPVGFREHANANLHGLRLVGREGRDYPLQDSFYQRGFGTGVRHRGAAAAMRINGAYTPPTEYTTVVA